MKKMLVLALVSLLPSLAPAADVSKPPTAKPPAARPPANQTRSKLIEKYDVNKDGKLDKTEIEAMRKDREAETIKKYDTNKDGKLDDAERKAMRDEMRKKMDATPTRPAAKPGQEPTKK